MKISLRKSNALQLSIMEMIGTISITTNVEISAFEEPMQVIAQKKQELLSNLERISNLRNALYDIRKKTSSVNSTGINDVLADIARLEKDIKTYSVFSSLTPTPDETVITGRLEKVRNKTEDSFYNSSGDTITVHVMDKGDIEQYRNRVLFLKKEKQKLQDLLLELNVKNEIILDDLTQDVLKGEGLL